MRNRSTATISLAGKSHRPIHLHIRTPSTRERRAVEMLHTACSALAPRPSSTRPPSDVHFHSPRSRSASHTTLLKDGTREFSGTQETSHAISDAASSVVRLLLRKCIYKSASIVPCCISLLLPPAIHQTMSTNIMTVTFWNKPTTWRNQQTLLSASTNHKTVFASLPDLCFNSSF